MKKATKRKGFTLVELLIVIVVIGILSAMMMLSSTEAVTSAKASNIVSNLRNMKTAALALFVDRLDDWESTASGVTGPKFSSTTDTDSTVIKYLNSTNSNTTTTSGTTTGSYKGYGIAAKGSGAYANRDWYVYYKFDNEARVREKLIGRAKSVGLQGATVTEKDNGVNCGEITADPGDLAITSDFVVMKVR